MIDIILSLVEKHFEHINLAVLIFVIICIIALITSGGLGAGNIVVGVFAILVAVIGVGVNVIHKYPQLVKRPEPTVSSIIV
jgi:hypothetical protein